MPAPVIVSPLCQSKDIEIVADIPAIVLCKCRKGATAFTIAWACRQCEGVLRSAHVDERGQH